MKKLTLSYSILAPNLKQVFLSVLLLILFVPGILAQVNIEQVNQNQNFDNGSVVTSEELLGIFLNSPLFSDIQQLAVDYNQVARINMEGTRNEAVITQSGSNNVGIIGIKGENNKATLTQTGQGLFSGIGVDGFSNELAVTQTGNDLQNLILLEGIDLDFDVLQTNDGVQLTQNGNTSIPLTIEHTGSVLPLIISNN